jgi:predicted nucleic acid-binding protein
MTALDTGPLVAIFHQVCIEALKGIKGPLVTTWPVITEAVYLLDYSQKVQLALLEFISEGNINIHHLGHEGAARVAELMGKYSSLPMDLTDASIVVMCEQLKIQGVFTLDRKDFSVYRPRHTKAFKLIPE